MVAVIAYQSLNSSSNKIHDLQSSTSQRFLRQAQATLALMYANNGGALQYPTNPDIEPHEAIQGPANLVPVSGPDAMDVKKPSGARKRTFSEMQGYDSEYHRALSRTLKMVKNKALQIYQQSYRQLSLGCDLIVFGELDSTHPDWHQLPFSAGHRLGSAVQTRACNCFSLYSSRYQNAMAIVGSGEGWCATRCNGVLAVFVHVPNAKAKDRDKMIKFYQTIKSQLQHTCGHNVVDLVMGDTNQNSAGFTPEVIREGMGQPFQDADATQGFTRPIDTWTPNGETIHRGTNAANNKKYDIALYNTDTVKSIEVKYMTQLSFTPQDAAAYTDHMGILVKVKKK